MPTHSSHIPESDVHIHSSQHNYIPIQKYIQLTTKVSFRVMATQTSLNSDLTNPQIVKPVLLTSMNWPDGERIAVINATIIDNYLEELKLRDAMQVTLDIALATLIHRNVGETILYLDLMKEMKPFCDDETLISKCSSGNTNLSSQHDRR